MNVYVYTLGCRLNQCESEAIAEAFEKSGHSVLKTLGDDDMGHGCAKPGSVDLVIVNTCTVTSKAEQKARRMIRLFSAKCPVLVTGCYAQMSPNEIAMLSGNVVVLPLSRKPELLRLPLFLSGRPQTDLLEALREFSSLKVPLHPNGSDCSSSADSSHAGSTHDESTREDSPHEDSAPKGQASGGRPLESSAHRVSSQEGQASGSSVSNFDYAPSGFTYHCRSYLKVQDGCDNNCGYCRVHIARGPSSSIDADVAVQRALEIERRGYHEIVLTGVNLTMYDHNGRGLGGLLEKLLANLGSDMRFRLSSMEPDNVDDFLLEQLKDPRVQPHFHIPIQSAAPKVMARINRNYSLEHLEYVVGRLREIKDDPFLACDVITGLPAEGPEEFEQTRRFLIDNGFAMMHVFPFSPRPDTALFTAKDRAPESVRDERAAVLRALALEMNQRYLERQVGRTVEAVLEENRNGTWYGLTGNYMRMRVDGVGASPSGRSFGGTDVIPKCGDLVRGVATSSNTMSCN